MLTPDRSFATLLREVVGSLQSILAAEARLVRAEALAAAPRLKESILFLACGALAGVFTVFFLLLSLLFALAQVLPLWAAALLTAAVSATAAAVTFNSGLRGLKLLQPAFQRTAVSLKDNWEWFKQYTK